jgi:hypothetical protein
MEIYQIADTCAIEFSTELLATAVLLYGKGRLESAQQATMEQPAVYYVVTIADRIMM